MVSLCPVSMRRKHPLVSWPLSILAVGEMPSSPQPSITCIAEMSAVPASLWSLVPGLTLLRLITQPLQSARLSGTPSPPPPGSGALGNSDLPTKLGTLLLPHCDQGRRVGGGGHSVGIRLARLAASQGKWEVEPSVLEAPNLPAESLLHPTPKNSVPRAEQGTPSVSVFP